MRIIVKNKDSKPDEDEDSSKEMYIEHNVAKQNAAQVHALQKAFRSEMSASPQVIISQDYSKTIGNLTLSSDIVSDLYIFCFKFTMIN